MTADGSMFAPPATAAVLGVLTAWMPCPLAASSAAILLGLRPGAPWRENLARAGAISAGLAAAGALAAAAAARGLLGLGTLSATLPDILRPFLAPGLILAGAILAGILPGRRPDRAARRPVPALLGAGLLLGTVLCPSVAGVLFGVLVPLSITTRTPWLSALAFGAGFGAATMVVALLPARGASAAAVRRNAGAIAGIGGWIAIVLGTWLTFGPAGR